MLSGSAKQKMLRIKTQASFPYLIEISHSTYGVFRYANCDDDIVFDNNTYTGSVFSISLPDIQENSVGNGKLTISSIDQTWIGRIRSTGERAELKFTAVIDYDDDHNVEQIEPIETFVFELSAADWDEQSITWDMLYDDGMNIVVPCDMATPQKIPGIA